MENSGSVLRTVFYAAMLTMCGIVCVVQCVTQFNLYWSEPSAMTVTIQQDVMFPAFTVCSSRKFSRQRVEALGVLNKRGTDVDWKKFPANASVERFWREAGTQLDELVFRCNRGACTGNSNGEAPTGHWTPLLARHGMCYTFVANQTLQVRNEEKLDILFHLYPRDYFNKMDKHFVDVYFHGGEPAIVQARYFNTQDHPKVKVQSGDITTVEVTGNAGVFKSLKRRYCRMQSGYTASKCRERCMWAHESRMNDCRAPWMVDLSDPLPLCNTSKQLFKMQGPPAIPRGSVSCPACPPTCRNERYSAQVTTTMNAAGMKKGGIAKLMASWPYELDLSTEELTYGLSGLISDVGGNMSLLLGVSVISIVQLTETLLHVLRHRLRYRLRRARARAFSVTPPSSASSGHLGHYTYTPPNKSAPLSVHPGKMAPPPAHYTSPPASMQVADLPRVASGKASRPWSAKRPT